MLCTLLLCCAMTNNLRFFAFLYAFCLVGSLFGHDNSADVEQPKVHYTHIYKGLVTDSHTEIFFLNIAFEDGTVGETVKITETLTISAADYNKLVELCNNRPSQGRDCAIAALPSCQKIVEILQRKDLPTHYAIRLDLPNKLSTVVYIYSSTQTITDTVKQLMRSYDIFQPSNARPTPIINLIKVAAAPEPSDLKKIATHPVTVIAGICGTFYGLKLLLNFIQKKRGKK